MVFLIGREPDRPRLMAPKETLLSAACKPVELNADGELRRQRTPTENILISRMLMCSGYCHVVDTAVFHFHHAGLRLPN